MARFMLPQRADNYSEHVLLYIWLDLGGACCSVMGIVLQRWAIRHIGMVLSSVQEKSFNKLVVDGPYSHVRHPLYLYNLRSQ